MAHSSTSTAAELLSPLPLRTVEVITASKPPTRRPAFCRPSATPRTRAAVVPFSSSRALKSSSERESGV